MSIGLHRRVSQRSSGTRGVPGPKPCGRKRSYASVLSCKSLSPHAAHCSLLRMIEGRCSAPTGACAPCTDNFVGRAYISK